MLLTVSFGKADPPRLRPLSDREWASFARWLRNGGHVPESLQDGDRSAILADWEAVREDLGTTRRMTVERVNALLERGMALAVRSEQWERAGLWVLTRSDPDYPSRLKHRLKDAAPAVLFGAGDRGLLDRGGLGVVGSRHAPEEGLEYAAALGRRAASESVCVISGGARGVDSAAMMAALEAGGLAVGVLGHSLLREATARRHRRHLVDGDLTLVSPFPPEARFEVWRVMERNQHIYCLTDAVVVAASECGRGGTREGAAKALARGWVSVWLNPSMGDESARAELLEHGALVLGEGVDRLSQLFRRSRDASPDRLLDASPRPSVEEAAELGAPSGAGERGLDRDRLYETFLALLPPSTSEGLTWRELCERLGLRQGQFRDWKERGLAENRIRKQGRPERFTRAKSTPDLFDVESP